VRRFQPRLEPADSNCDQAALSGSRYAPNDPHRNHYRLFFDFINIKALFLMPTDTQRLDDLNSIRQYVTETLCEKDRLETNSFPLYERVLTRGGSPCGVHFCLYGPRSLYLAAIWETDSNTILFYGSRGERFRKTKLIAAPSIDDFVSTAA
jgi:hypothetical protein